MSFAELKKMAAPLDDVFAVWGFGGGWAIDGTIGKVTREHGDVDICILREDLAEWREVWPEALWYKIVDGREVELGEGEIPQLPVHELHVRDGDAFYELLLQDTDGDDWVYRRDARIKMPVEEVFVAGPERLSFLNPAVALLFKSKNIRDIDMKDFKAVLPFLSDFERQWLLKALEIVYGEHIWMDTLKGAK
jgi:Aminoglycoside-2''-adenylyltransferase